MANPLVEGAKTIAKNVVDAATFAESDRNGLQLRGMNMLYEVMKAGSGTVILVPSSALDAMNLGGLVSLNGVTAHP